MDVTPDSVDVSTYFALRLTATGVEATGLTVTNFDLQYVRSGQAPSTKVDATALGATNSAHSDNTAIEIDATDQPGLYRVDWPDAAFAAGVREVILTVTCASVFTEHLRVQLQHAQSGDTFVRLGAPVGASISADIADVEGKVDDLETRLGVPTSGTIAGDIADVETKVDDLETRLGTPTDLGGGATIAANLVVIEAQTDDIGTAGAGLTAIPSVGSVTGNVGGNVTGSVGSVTAAVAVGTIAANAITAAALATDAVAEVADGVWDEPLSGHLTAGSAGSALNGAGSAGDPWTTSLPGAYGAGTAGNILGTNLNATVSTRATQTSVDSVQTDTNDLQTRLPAALVSGRIDASVGAMSTDTLTANALATDAVTEIQSGLSTLTPAQVGTEVDSALADVGLTTTVTGRIDATVSSRATPAQVNAEVLDVLTVDTFAQPGQENPAATTTLGLMLRYVYKILRNKKDNTGSENRLYADNGTTIDQKQSTTEAAGTVTIGEWSTGP